MHAHSNASTLAMSFLPLSVLRRSLQVVSCIHTMACQAGCQCMADPGESEGVTCCVGCRRCTKRP